MTGSDRTVVEREAAPPAPAAGTHPPSRLRQLAGRLRRGALPGAVVLLGLAIAAVALVALPQSQQPESSGDLRTTEPVRIERAFSADSWWNTPLPDDVPTYRYGDAVLSFLRTGSRDGNGCLQLAGAGDSPWGLPMYWARPGDREYDVRSTGHVLPPELRTLRIPAGAEPAQNSDAAMVVYDVERGYVVALTGAVHDPGTDEWTASGGTVSYLDSNGLNRRTGRSDDRRNEGSHRGNVGPVMAVSWDQVRADRLDHVLKIAIGPPASTRSIFPMVGSDGDYEGTNPAVPPQGMRLRISPDVDLDALDLEPQALVIARAIQRYGVYIGDSGGATALKLEDTRLEGRSQLWNIDADALCSIPFEPGYWDVVAQHYDPTGGR